MNQFDSDSDASWVRLTPCRWVVLRVESFSSQSFFGRGARPPCSGVLRPRVRSLTWLKNHTEAGNMPGFCSDTLRHLNESFFARNQTILEQIQALVKIRRVLLICSAGFENQTDVLVLWQTSWPATGVYAPLFPWQSARQRWGEGAWSKEWARLIRVIHLNRNASSPQIKFQHRFLRCTSYTWEIENQKRSLVIIRLGFGAFDGPDSGIDRSCYIAS